MNNIFLPISFFQYYGKITEILEQNTVKGHVKLEMMSSPISRKDCAVDDELRLYVTNKSNGIRTHLTHITDFMCLESRLPQMTSTWTARFSQGVLDYIFLEEIQMFHTHEEYYSRGFQDGSLQDEETLRGNS